MLDLLTNLKEMPSVSVIIPCRNEVGFIANFLDSILSNGYPLDKLEILVVDGISEDGTREIIQRYTERHGVIRLLDNPRKVTPYALNIGIRVASGDVVMRLDAHSVCVKGYIASCVEGLFKYGADDVGGTLRIVARDDTLMGRAIVKALTNRFGVGNLRYRFLQPVEPTLVDTVPFFCCRRQLFQTIGLFNEKLTRGQDMEFKRRLTRAGFKIMLAPGAYVDYQARSDLRAFCRHNWADGVWTVLAFAHSDLMPVRWRHLAPACLIGALLGSGMLVIASPVFGPVFLSIAGIYGLAALAISLRVGFAERDVRYVFLVPLVIATMHMMRGLGSLWGVVRLLSQGRFVHAVRLALQEQSV